MNKLRVVAGISVFLAAIFSWLWILTLFNRLYIQYHRDRYRVANFLVVDTGSGPSRKGFPGRWLTGTVDGRTERLKLQLPPGVQVHSRDDVLALFPQGSTIPVLYHPEALEAMIQGETVRTLHFTPDFWERETRLLVKFLYFVLLPVPLAWAFYRWTLKRPGVAQRFSHTRI